MSQQSTQNATTTVQVKEVGLNEQASVGKVLLVAGAAAGAAAGLISLLGEKAQETPPTRTESAKEYLRSALEEAQKKDFGKMSRKQRKAAEKNLKKQRAKAGKDAEKLIAQSKQVANDSATAVRDEVSTLMDQIKSGGMELDRLVEGFAESTLMQRLREFGDEAKVIAEQGKMRGSEVAHKAQDDLAPKVKDAAQKAKDDLAPKVKDAAEKAREEIVPQVKDAAEQAAQIGKEKLTEVSEKTRTEFVPNAQKFREDASAQAKEKLGHVAEDAEQKLSEAAQTVDEKRKDATAAVQRGGRETRSLLLWVSLAGILIFTVFLDEDQQKKLKEVAFEVFGEARDMYGDMKGQSGN